MAKFVEQKIEITISKMFKSSEAAVFPIADEQIASLEEIVSELAGDGCIVEVVKTK